MDFVVLTAAFLCLHCGGEEEQQPGMMFGKYVICRRCGWLTDVTARRGEADKLRAELWHQWRVNHGENCGWDTFHEGDCDWPVPEVLRPY
ncbi:hypothetical protein BH24ACT15_BH24ACT15_34990 [soil metagenome]